MIKHIIFIFYIIFFLNGCEKKEITFPSSCTMPTKQIHTCQNFLKYLEIDQLVYQKCELVEAVPSGYFEAIYFIKEENVDMVEKELINKVNIKKFTKLNAIQLSKSVVKAHFCIENVEVSLFVDLKNNPLGRLNGLSNTKRDYKILARVPAGEI